MHRCRRAYVLSLAFMKSATPPPAFVAPSSVPPLSQSLSSSVLRCSAMLCPFQIQGRGPFHTARRACRTYFNVIYAPMHFSITYLQEILVIIMLTNLSVILSDY